MEPIEIAGEWWLPQSPSRKVSGTLRIDAGGRAELNLMGALRDYLDSGESTIENGQTTITVTEESIHRSGIYPRIHGFDGSHGYTLEDCMRTRRTAKVFGGFETERVLANQVFRGLLFEEGEPIQFTSIYIWLDWLAYWVGRTGLDESTDFARSEDWGEQRPAATLKLYRLPSETFPGVDGGSVTLGQSWEISGDGVTERRLTQDFHFSIWHQSLRALRALLDQASDLQALVSIGTDHRAAFRSISLRHPQAEESRGGRSYERGIDFYAPWTMKHESSIRTLSEYDMLFTLPDLGGVSGVERWLKVAAKYRTQLQRVVGSRFADSMFVTDRLLNCAVALESYDRVKHSDEISYAERLRRCVAYAAEPFGELVGQGEPWVQALRKARNDVAHDNLALADSSTLHYVLSRSAYWLFVLCLLRDSSAPDAVLIHMRQHPEFRSLQRDLREVLA